MSEPAAELVAEPGRYRLYGSYACPFASRAIIMRALKGLGDAIELTLLDPVRDPVDSWRFPAGAPDAEYDWRTLNECFVADDPSFDGRATVPVLWDRKTRRILSNDSLAIMRMLDKDFNELARRPELDFCPVDQEAAIDALCAEVHEAINTGVYRCGSAASQREYEAAVTTLFDDLAGFERHLAGREWLTGEHPTEADLLLALTLFRFDSVYATLFKCSIRRIVDHPNLWAFARRVHALPGVAETVDLDQIKRHYFCANELNPTGIVPAGPLLDWTPPEAADRLESPLS